MSIGNYVIQGKNGRYIVSEAAIDDVKRILINIHAPNDQTQQLKFIADLSNSVLNSYVNETLVIGGDFNCPLNDWDKRGGRPVEHKKNVIQEINNLMETYDLFDTRRIKNPSAQGYTWNNPSMKIQCRQDYFLLSKDIRSSLKAIKIVPNVFSDHSALSLVLTHCEKEATRGPDFWKCNNSLLINKEYVDLITAKIREFVLKYPTM